MVGKTFWIRKMCPSDESLQTDLPGKVAKEDVLEEKEKYGREE